MFDRKRSFFSEELTKDVATGATIADEGAILVYVEESGDKKVQLSTGVAHETIAGFSVIDAYQPAVDVKVETGSIPSAPGPYTVTLSHSNLVATQIRVYDVTTSATLTEVAGPGVAAQQYVAVDSTGVITFNSANAGDSIIVWYKYYLTVAESQMIYHQRHANAGASAFLQICEVGGGIGEIYTDQYDVSKTYTGLAAGQLVAGANGIFTTGGAGTSFAIVIHAPDTTNPLLGVKFTISNTIA